MGILSEKQRALLEAINCLLIKTGEAQLLLPMAAVAEVIHTVPLARDEELPPWVMGRVDWRGAHVPVIDFTALQSGEQASGELQSSHRMLILRRLGGSTGDGYYGMVTNGFPRAFRLQEDSGVTVLGDIDPVPLIGSQMQFADQVFHLPDFAALEERLAEIPAFKQ